MTCAHLTKKLLKLRKTFDYRDTARHDRERPKDGRTNSRSSSCKSRSISMKYCTYRLPMHNTAQLLAANWAFRSHAHL